ncbi:CG0192-related protein [Psychromicrobium xiongbiense]|uniref:CG0192-related protein n=1 Tax=Psychromicrobium xiongbiense TaxID=3051184 RepID=UPI002556D396|nr:hypothetical protein [Psychromicrobium sp. YIM S02556]
MALLHRATLTPSKLELIQHYLPSQPWGPAGAGAPLELLGSYRFDDPDGEVGLEAHLVSDGERVCHVPLSYRGAPLPGAEAWLVGTMEHSVLGTRWVYDGCADSVFLTAFATAMLTGGQQAEQFVEVDGALEPRPSTAAVQGSGGSEAVPIIASPQWPVTAGTLARVTAAGLALQIARLVDAADAPEGQWTLTGRWSGLVEPVRLAAASLVGSSLVD